ncbi:MAG: hypothetical protein E7Y34_02410, partial [Mycoplasma sp.]|nr:hypothetical protein [Mycoplasma sp.]
KKVLNNAREIKNELIILNRILQTKMVEDEMIKVIYEYPKITTILPLLVGKRQHKIETIDKVYDFKNIKIDEILYFLRKSKILELIKAREITNFYDFYLGLEIGLDSNARKNRTGELMKKRVIQFLDKNKVNYELEINSNSLLKHFGLEKSELDLIFSKNDAIKRFDFVFEKNGIIYLGEINAYMSSGSKLNEIAKSYIYLNESIKRSKKCKFIWITDGYGWKKTKQQIYEAFQKIEYIFNLNDLKNYNLDELI